MRTLLLPVLLAACVCAAAPATEPLERRETFDRDPGWDGMNHRRPEPETRELTQDFGYSRTAHTGGAPGELGGTIYPAAEPAYYAKPIDRRTLDEALTASGVVAPTGRHFNVLIGFFNADAVNEWRTPNSLALRLYGRGDVFYAYVEYCTGRWRAGADTPIGFTEPDPVSGREGPIRFPAGEAVYRWSLRYDPEANDGGGAIYATVGDREARCDLDPGHRADGAVFNRFGLLNVVKSLDDGGEIWLDDLSINGELERFDRDPGWEGFQNRRVYRTAGLRPQFDFGWNPSNHAGGERPGELGGIIYRGDCRYPEKMAYYGDRVGPLSLRAPLRAGGRISFHRGVSDSTSLLGFFHHAESVHIDESQRTGWPEPFVGVALEGPSAEGFFLYPVVRVDDQTWEGSRVPMPLRIYPNGEARSWAMTYTPGNGAEPGAIELTLDGQRTRVELPARVAASDAELDRFGIVTTRIDGNAQRVYWDDLTYTARR